MPSRAEFRCPLTHKASFVDRESAEAWMRKFWGAAASGRSQTTYKPTQVYLCECGWWHLTSSHWPKERVDA